MLALARSRHIAAADASMRARPLGASRGHGSRAAWPDAGHHRPWARSGGRRRPRARSSVDIVGSRPLRDRRRRPPLAVGVAADLHVAESLATRGRGHGARAPDEPRPTGMIGAAQLATHETQCAAGQRGPRRCHRRGGPRCRAPMRGPSRAPPSMSSPRSRRPPEQPATRTAPGPPS